MAYLTLSLTLKRLLSAIKGEDISQNNPLTPLPSIKKEEGMLAILDISLFM